MNKEDDEIDVEPDPLDEEPDLLDTQGDSVEAVPDGDAPKTVPYKRLQKVVAERNASRDRILELEETSEKSNLELVELKAFRDTMSDRYSRFRNPAAQLSQDADFMSALEELAKKDREIHDFYRKVVTFMETGERKSPAAAEAPKADPRLDKILEREAKRSVAEVLEPLQLQPRFMKMISKHVLDGSKGEELSTAQVKKLTREFLTENDYKLVDVQIKDATTKLKPATTRGPGAGAASQQRSEPTVDPAKFKNREEYLEHRRGVLDKLIADLSA